MGVTEALLIGTAVSAVVTAGTTIYSANKAEAARKEQAQQARVDAAKAKADYLKQTAAVEAETAKVLNLENEKKKRLVASKTKLPKSVLSGGFTGVTDTPVTQKKKLLGA